MSGSDTYLLQALRGLLGKSSAVTDRTTEFVLKKFEVNILEMEDVLFHLNSAVMMPEAPSGKSSADGSEDDDTDWIDRDVQEDQETITGVSSLALVFKQFEFDPAKAMVIAGHTDTSDTARFNFELSDKRANNVRYLLTGARADWAKNCGDRHRVEDYQQITKYFAVRKGWDCDPGKIDNIWGPKTEKATKNFFHQTDPAEADNMLAQVKAHGQKHWPEKAWLGVYDLYEEVLCETLEVSKPQLGVLRSTKLRFLDNNKPYVACGESFPIDDAEKSNYRSQRNRRVEILFFDDDETKTKDNKPLLICPARTSTVHTKGECPLWRKSNFIPLYIDPADLHSVVYHIRFIYYDRVLKKITDVPEGLKIRAFEIKSDGKGSRPLPTITVYKNGVHYVKVRFGNQIKDPARQFLYFDFETTDKWIYTKDSSTKPKIVTWDPATKPLDPEERWKHYDLPAKWTSKQAWTRYEGTDEDIKNNRDKGEKFTWVFNDHLKLRPIGDAVTAPDKPLIFSLDDVLVTDEKHQAIPNMVGEGAIFDENFAVINPDSSNNKSYYTKNGIKGSQIPFPGKRVHGILHKGKLYAVFNERVPSGGYAGHRVATYKHKDNCILVNNFQQRHYRRYKNIGKFDAYLLRQQGFEDGREISYIFNLFRWHLKDAAGGNSVTPAWIDTTITNLTNEWNDQANNQLVSLVPDDVNLKHKINLRYYIEQVAQGQQHTIVTVHPAGTAGRSFMGRDDGEIRANQNLRQPAPTGFVAAHEYGHASSLDDDYVERWLFCCYFKPGFEDFKPGAPFNLQDQIIMNHGGPIGPRSYWHFSAWMCKEFISGQRTPFNVIMKGKPVYKLPDNAADPWNPRQFGPEARNYYNYPDKTQRAKQNTKTNKGKFDLYLYPLGDDDYSQGGLYAGKNFTGLLIVTVNLYMKFWNTATYFEIYDAIDKIYNRVNAKFVQNDAVKICGDAPYSETFVQVQSRFLVEKFVKVYILLNPNLITQATQNRIRRPNGTLDLSLLTNAELAFAQASYAAEVNRLLARPEGTPHCTVNVTSGGATSWDTTTNPHTLNLKKSDVLQFWKYFAELLGLNNGAKLSPANFAVGAIVPHGVVRSV